MTKLLTIPRFYGPLFTILVTVIYHYLSGVFGFSVSVMPLIVILALGSFVGGLWAGLICAAWISLYAFWAIPDDLSRIIQIGLGSVGVALIIGWQTNSLRELCKATDEHLNGNVARLNEALKSLRLAKDKNIEARKLMERAEHNFGNVLGSMVGYTKLRQDIDEVERWYEIPENVRRLQEMDKFDEVAQRGHSPTDKVEPE